MPVKIKDIDGALIDRPIGMAPIAYGRLITQQGEVQIGLNREKLAAFLYNRKMKDYPIPNDEDILEVTAESYREVDAIIAYEHNILEVKK